MAQERRQGADRLWTPSNVITITRICLVPVFVVALISPWPQWFGLDFISNEVKSLIAAGIFILISATDWVDGYLARKRDEVTSFGKFMDPLADKILVVAALLALVELSVLPAWPVLIIIARDIIVSGLRMVAASRGVVIAASWYGKAKTVFQIIAIILFLIKDSLVLPTAGDALGNPLYVISWIVMFIALFLTLLSLLDYLAKARNILMGPEPAPAQTSDELARQVLDAARERQLTIATAESLTGGLIAATLVDIPGSSDVVCGGIVSYQARLKEALLDVPVSVIADDGVVSEACAQAMADGARKTTGADIAVAVTGIAGPGGAEEGKPVGTVWLAVADKRGCQAKCCHFDGARSEVRASTVDEALRMTLATIVAADGR